MRIGAIKLVDEYAGRTLAALATPFLGSRKAAAADAPRAILFVKFWGLGSIVLASPAVRAARAAFPHARVDMLTLAGNEAACECLGLFDRVRTVRIDTAGRFVGDAVGVLTSIRRARYDVVVDLELFAYVSALAAVASGAPRRLGFAKRGRALFTETVPFDSQRHVAESFRALAEALVGARLPSFELRVPRSPSDDRALEGRLETSGVRRGDFLVAMNVNASPLAFERRWERAKFAALAARLSARFGAHVILTGSESERAYVDGLLAELPSPAAVTNLAGRLSFRELVALLGRADLLVTNDSGPLHVASALDTPTVALFGPETPARYGPLASKHLVYYLGLACSPCMSVDNRKTVDCHHDRLCMRSLSVDNVWDGVERFVRQLGVESGELGGRRG
jgi:lipopolysaccharide heptosyltransferase II